MSRHAYKKILDGMEWNWSLAASALTGDQGRKGSK